jgi:hypothetical protein
LNYNLMQYSHALCERFPSVLVLYYKWHKSQKQLVSIPGC